MSGHFWGTTDFDRSAGKAMRTSVGEMDAYVARYDASGALISAVAFGGTGREYVNDLALDARGNAVIVGSFEGVVDFDPGPGVTVRSSAGNTDAFVARYDVSGDLIWVATFGGSRADEGLGVTIAPNGNAIVTGAFTGSVDFDPGPGVVMRSGSGGNSTDGFMVQFGANGDFASVLIVRSEYEAGAGNQTKVEDAALASNGDVVITGSFSGNVDFDPGSGMTRRTSTGSGTDIFVARYDANGAFLSVAALNGTLNSSATEVALDASGNAVVAGYFFGIVDFDPGSALENRNSRGYWNGFLARYDTNGALVSVVQLAATMMSSAVGVVIDASGNAVVAGTFWGTMDFDAGDGVESRISAGQDGYVARYAPTGELLSVATLGATGDDYGSGLTLDGSGNAVLTGTFQGTVDFDPGVGTLSVSSTGPSDVYVVRYTPSGTLAAGAVLTKADDSGVVDAIDMRVSNIAPNPAREVSYVRIETGPSQRVRVRVYDLLGRVAVDAFDESVAAGVAMSVALETAGLPSGMYIVRIEGDRIRSAQPLTVAR